MPDMKDYFREELDVIKRNQVEIMETKNSVENVVSRQDQSKDAISGPEDKVDVLEHLLITLKK